MKKTFASWTSLVAATMTLAALPAQAQDAGLPLWEAGVFGGIATTPAYPGSADRSSRALVLPLLIYRGEIFRADNSGIGARLFRTNDVELDVGFSGSLPASSDAITARRDMPDLGTLVEFGPRVKWTLSRPTATSRVRLDLPLRAVIEFNAGVRGQGVAFEPTLTYENRNFTGGWGLSTSASLIYGDSKLNSYFYGVEPKYATVARPAYDARAGLISTRLALGTSKKLTPDLMLFGFLRYESYAGSANTQSALFLNNSGTSVGIGLTWTLARSESRARD